MVYTETDFHLEILDIAKHSKTSSRSLEFVKSYAHLHTFCACFINFAFACYLQFAIAIARFMLVFIYA